ncbi:MAG: cohesin domain-containing protein [Acidobacteriota bacterium]
MGRVERPVRHDPGRRDPGRCDPGRRDPGRRDRCQSRFGPRRAALGMILLLLAGSGSSGLAATLSLPAGAGAPPGASTVVPLQVDDAAGMLGTDILIAYDPAVAIATGVSPTPLSASQTLTVNLNGPGVIVISLFGAYPLDGSGALLDLSFTSVGPLNSRTVLDLASADINEGGIPVMLLDGQYCVQGPTEEVRGLEAGLAAPGSTVAILSWAPDPLAASFNVYRGESPDLSDLACFLPGVTGTSTADDGALPPGGLFVYMVTAANCRGESTLGFDSTGSERMNSAPCSP